jgi:hypothetical protein
MFHVSLPGTSCHFIDFMPQYGMVQQLHRHRKKGDVLADQTQQEWKVEMPHVEQLPLFELVSGDDDILTSR